MKHNLSPLCKQPQQAVNRFPRLLAHCRKNTARLLCGLLAGLALTGSANAGRSVPVQIDGTHLPGQAYLEDGVTYVPLRYLLDTLGGWEIIWDYTTQQAVAVAEALGNHVEWDPYLSGAAVTSSGADHNAVDLYWLSRIIYAESGAEPLDGQIAVGNVVLHRVASPEFPNSVAGVIFDRVNGTQFEPVENGTVYRTPSPQSAEAAVRVLNGDNTIGSALYFYAPALSQGVWIQNNRTFLKTIGCHRFYL